MKFEKKPVMGAGFVFEPDESVGHEVWEGEDA